MITTNQNQTDDLRQIVATLDAQIADQDRQITEATTHLGELQQELASIRQNKANYTNDLQNAAIVVSQLRQDLAKAQTDYTLAKGTSVESTKQRELDQVQEQLTKAENEQASLQFSFEHDSQAEQETTARLLELQNQVAALVAEKSDAAATRDRFDREHANHVREIGLAALQECDDEIDTLESKLRDAKAQRWLTQVELASNLHPWPQLAEATLSEVLHVEDGPDACLLQARLALINALDKASPGAQKIAAQVIPLDSLRAYGGLSGWRMAEDRRIATGGWHADTTMQRFSEHAAEVERLLGELRSADCRAQAAALARQEVN